ncbi:WecB/TagA/CpsF family glycosyltransferase [Rhodococcus sp. NPDC047139]|uniref:WecB/TagA/CpsF family glycosyltransferase n=1 Tax=Rhodococcus sp. NPDC047139 TaxID=3155141 RepID=UPI0033C8DBD2
MPIDAVTMDEAVARCLDALEHRNRMTVGVLNAAKTVRLRKDTALRDSLLECDMLLADGQAVVWAGNLLGYPLPERVTGIDLFTSLLATADSEHLSVYLLGAEQSVLDDLVKVLAAKYPGLRIAGAQNGYFAPSDEEPIAQKIRASGADMLFLGMPSPRKENFLRRWEDLLEVPIRHGVGGSFDVLAGITKRAPERWQRAGMEWAYRLLQEPRRMWRRYLTTNTAFLFLLARELFHTTPPYRPSKTLSVARKHHG